MNSTRFGASSLACCLSYDVRRRLLFAAILDIATRSLFRLRTLRLLHFEVNMAKCQVQKVARGALSMRHTVSSLTHGGESHVAKVLEVHQTECAGS